MKTILLSVLKWWLIIAFAGVTFYLVVPKWEPHPRNKHVVINTITGKVYKRSIEEPKKTQWRWPWEKKKDYTTKITIRSGGKETTKVYK